MSMDTGPLGTWRNYPAQWLAAACMVSERQARRWKAAGRAPCLAVAWLDLLHNGDLGALHPSWRGWCIGRDGELHDAETAWHFPPSELRAFPLRYAELSALRVEARRLSLAATEREQQQQRERGRDGRPHDALARHTDGFETIVTG